MFPHFTSDTVLRCRLRRYRHAWRRLSWRQRVVLLVGACAPLYLVYSLINAVLSPEARAISNSTALSGTKASALPLNGHGDVSSHTSPAGGLRGQGLERSMNGTTRMRKRQQLLRRYCEHVYQSDVIDPAGESLFRTTSLVSERLNLLYCPVGKIASTLLTRFLVAAGETHPVISPYAMSPQKALRVRFKNTGLNILFSRLSKLVPARGRGKDEQIFMGKLTRMLFVRCPFRRLWSAYVDKLLFPNPHYWQAWGLPALNTPNSQDGGDLQCGENVTFPQFIDFVLDRLHQLDTHVRPVSWECAPCHVDYDVIGRVETLTSDVMHLAGLLRLDMDRNLRRLDWEEEHAKDVIKEAVKNVFSRWTSEIRVCISMDTAAQRLWRALQIQGIISQKVAYPFAQTEGQVVSLDASQMINTLLDAHEKSGARELERQKNAAFLGAYKMVPTRQKDEIRRVYKADFEMFGYDPYYL